MIARALTRGWEEAKGPKARRPPGQQGEDCLTKPSPSKSNHWTPGSGATLTVRLVPPNNTCFSFSCLYLLSKEGRT